MTHSWSEMGLRIPAILLPKEGTDFRKWAVVACDQYTSEPDYWADVEKIVGDAPSALRLMLPEYFLGTDEEESRKAGIRACMKKYVEDGTLTALPKGCMLVRRTSLGNSRLGLVIAVDLEAYDCHKGSSSIIRATEGTVASRIPPRLKIRRGAPLEMPHIIILIDDPGKTVLERMEEEVLQSLRAEAGAGGAANGQTGMRFAYDFDLMKNGGHITGYFIPEQEMDPARKAFSALFDQSTVRYGAGHEFLMAMGDGNHSLATAKAAWEEIRQTIPQEEWESCPARYALCEIENVHDEGIVFAPIHRVVFGQGKLTGEQILEETVQILNEQNGNACFTDVTEENAEGDDTADGIKAKNGETVFRIPVLTGGDERMILIKDPSSGLEVGAVQNALDELVKREGLKIDYIHGGDTVMLLTADGTNAGFLMPPMDKFRLFPAVARDGALPRKTFSMGQACEKRYYIECRKLT